MIYEISQAKAATIIAEYNQQVKPEYAITTVGGAAEFINELNWKMQCDYSTPVGIARHEIVPFESRSGLPYLIEVDAND